MQGLNNPIGIKSIEPNQNPFIINPFRFTVQITFGTGWASTGALSTGRNSHWVTGSSTSGLAFGGVSPSGTTSTEEFTGSTWSSGGALSTAVRKHSGCGDSINDSISFGGATDKTTTEEYNGTSWSSGGALSTGRTDPAGAGVTASGLCINGVNSSTALTSCEEYNGTSWSAGGATGTAKSLHASGGTQTEAIEFAGYAASPSKVSELYNGTSWSVTGSTASLTHNAGGGAKGGGGSNGALGFGGPGDTSTVTEKFETSSWSSGGALNTGRRISRGAGDLITALCAGGDASGTQNTTSCELWS